MKSITKTGTTTFKTWHRTLALLLLILIAFSSVSCNTVSLPDSTEAQSQSEETEELRYHDMLEIPEEKIVEIKAMYDQKIVPEHHTFPSGVQSLEDGQLELQTYGRFGNSYAVYAKSGSRSVYWEIIKGFEFRYTHVTPYIYFNTEFYELGEAVEKGLIYNGDIETIHKNYKERNYDLYYKQYSYPTMQWTFYGKELYVTVQPQYNDKKYTVEDFAEIGCVNVEDVTKISFEEEPNKIDKRWRLDLGRESKEWAIEVVAKLYERDDVFLVRVDSYNEYGEISHNDPEYTNGHQWVLDKIKMPDAWELQTDASSVRVGVVDSGVQFLDELYYRCNLELSKSFIEDEYDDPMSDSYSNGGHGTKVASVIAATTNNSTGMAGVCWDVDLVSLKTNNDRELLVEALEYAAENNILIINYSQGSAGAFDSDEKDAIERFPGLVICCAGNNNSNNDTVPYYPASYDLNNIIVVGGSNMLDQKYDSSSYGATTVDLFAPGYNVCVMNKYGEYDQISATSYATPIVTGVVALMWARYPTRSREWIKAKLLESVDTVSILNGKCVTGGRLNAHRALCEHSSSNVTYTQTTNGMHIRKCNACGYRDTVAHVYTYTSLNSTQHRINCYCGYSVTENHNKITDTNRGVIYCSKCPYQLGLWSIEEEYELM